MSYGIANSIISYQWKFTRQGGGFSDYSTFLKLRVSVTGPKVLQHYMSNIFIVSFLWNMTALITGILSIKLAGMVMSILVGAMTLFILYYVFEVILKYKK